MKSAYVGQKRVGNALIIFCLLLFLCANTVSAYESGYKDFETYKDKGTDQVRAKLIFLGGLVVVSDAVIKYSEEMSLLFLTLPDNNYFVFCVNQLLKEFPGLMFSIRRIGGKLVLKLKASPVELGICPERPGKKLVIQVDAIKLPEDTPSPVVLVRHNKDKLQFTASRWEYFNNPHVSIR